MNVLMTVFVCLLFILGAGLSEASMQQLRTQSQQQEETTDIPVENPFWLRIRNRLRDMLGYGNDSCQTLVEITGHFTTDGSLFYTDDIEVHFGPTWYIISQIATEDYDGDGELEIIYEELLGLVGSIVVFEGIYQSDNWFSTFIINNMVYRELGQPIWSHGKGDGHGNGP